MMLKNHLSYSFAVFSTTRGNYTQFRTTSVKIISSFALNFFKLYFNKGLKIQAEMAQDKNLLSTNSIISNRKKGQGHSHLTMSKQVRPEIFFFRFQHPFTFAPFGELAFSVNSAGSHMMNLKRPNLKAALAQKKKNLFQAKVQNSQQGDKVLSRESLFVLHSSFSISYSFSTPPPNIFLLLQITGHMDGQERTKNVSAFILKFTEAIKYYKH